MKGSSTPPIRDSFTAAEIKRYQAGWGNAAPVSAPRCLAALSIEERDQIPSKTEKPKARPGKGNDHAHRLCL